MERNQKATGLANGINQEKRAVLFHLFRIAWINKKNSLSFSFTRLELVPFLTFSSIFRY
jgi:hypothetical protein